MSTMGWISQACPVVAPEAQFNLGVMDGNGHGVSQDDAECVAWYRLAAEQGNRCGMRVFTSSIIRGTAVSGSSADTK